MNRKPYKSVKSLLKHLRNDNGMNIRATRNLKQLEVIGYFHSYKGYRFIRDIRSQINFTKFDELYNLVEFEYKLKELFYPVLMKIETGLKNITIEKTMYYASSNYIDTIVERSVIFDETINTSNITSDILRNKLSYKKNWINDALTTKNKKHINHYLDNYFDIPFWAVVDRYTFGELINLFNVLNQDVKSSISNYVNIRNADILMSHMVLLKDLRNSIAHNNIIFDCRFYASSPSVASKRLIDKFLPNGINVSFRDSLIDYVVLCCYYLKNLGFKENEIKKFVINFESCYQSYFSKHYNIARLFMSNRDFIILKYLKSMPF